MYTPGLQVENILHVHVLHGAKSLICWSHFTSIILFLESTQLHVTQRLSQHLKIFHCQLTPSSESSTSYSFITFSTSSINGSFIVFLWNAEQVKSSRPHSFCCRKCLHTMTHISLNQLFMILAWHLYILRSNIMVANFSWSAFPRRLSGLLDCLQQHLKRIDVR